MEKDTLPQAKELIFTSLLFLFPKVQALLGALNTKSVFSIGWKLQFRTFLAWERPQCNKADEETADEGRSVHRND
jgi:hypothetical protein